MLHYRLIPTNFAERIPQSISLNEISEQIQEEVNDATKQ
jgi:hypothetical protein